METVIEKDRPFNGECELCYSAHKFQPNETFFHVLHEWSPDDPINICKICFFSHSPKLISKHIFNPTNKQAAEAG